MKKAQSRAVHCYTDCFKATRHLLVAKTERLEIRHYNKGHCMPVVRGNDELVMAFPKAGGASDTFQSLTPQVRI